MNLTSIRCVAFGGVIDGPVPTQGWGCLAYAFAIVFGGLAVAALRTIWRPEDQRVLSRPRGSSGPGRPLSRLETIGFFLVLASGSLMFGFVGAGRFQMHIPEIGMAAGSVLLVIGQVCRARRQRRLRRHRPPTARTNSNMTSAPEAQA